MCTWYVWTILKKLQIGHLMKHQVDNYIAGRTRGLVGQSAEREFESDAFSENSPEALRHARPCALHLCLCSVSLNLLFVRLHKYMHLYVQVSGEQFG